jgi:WD40 repeat protein
MFSCITTDEDEDELDAWRGRLAAEVVAGRNASGAACVLPLPEVVTDHASSVYSVAISHVGDIISGGCGEIYINRYGEYEETSSVKGMICGYEKVYSLAIVYGVEPRLYSGHADGSLRSWDLMTKLPLKVITAHDDAVVSVCTLQGAEAVVLTASTDGQVKCFDPELADLYAFPRSEESILSMAVEWQGESSVVLLGLANGIVSVWMYSPPETTMRLREITSSSSPPRSLAISGKIFAVGRSDGVIEVRSVRHGTVHFYLEGHSDCVRSLDIFDGKVPILVSGSWDSTICLWNLVSGLRMQRLSGHSDEVTSVAVSKGPVVFVVSGSKDWTVRVWDITDATK